MSSIVEKLNLYQDLKDYHDMLNEVLAAYVRDHDPNDNLVHRAIEVIRRHPEFPMKLSLAMDIDEAETTKRIIEAARDAGLLD